MVFWMKRTARTLRNELQGKVENAVSAGPLALAGVAFIAVIREGLETSLFVYTNFQTVADVTSSTVGLLLGFAVSIVLGYLIYKSAIRLNLAKFFTYSGVALIIVAAGVLSYGIHEFQELGYLPGPDAFAGMSPHLSPRIQSWAHLCQAPSALIQPPHGSNWASTFCI
jgi:high-affinity iron transporter